MKRSEINRAIQDASNHFAAHGWTLPPEPAWDVTDFGLGDFAKSGLVLVNLAAEPEYCEKLMFARRDQQTPAHCHRQKKEDIIARWGTLAVQVWKAHPAESGDAAFELQINGRKQQVRSGDTVRLPAGHRVTLTPGVYHAFWPETEACIIGEVSTANDDLHDNYFVDPDIGRFPELVEDEPALVRLVSDR